MKPNSIRLALTLVSALGVSACTSGPWNKTTPAQVAYQWPQETQLEPIQGLNRHTLYPLLLAEIAGQRNQVDLALQEYIKLARASQHPRIAERAAYIAQYEEKDQLALEAARIWAQAEPQSVDAQRILVMLLMKTHAYTQALTHLHRLYELTGSSYYTLLANRVIEQNAQDALNVQEIYQKLRAYHTKTPASLDYLNALAIFEVALNHPVTAQQHLNQVLAQAPNNERALLLKAQILREQDELQEALNLLKAGLKRQPESLRLLLEYARLQLAANDLQGASQTFAQIRRYHPGDSQVVLALARLYVEQGELQAARQELESLLERDEASVDLSSPETLYQAFYYLGRIAQEEADQAQALDYYWQVGPSSVFVDAKLRALQMLEEQNALPEAVEALQQQRQDFSQQDEVLLMLMTDLLYKHAQYQTLVDVLTDAMQSRPEYHQHTRFLYARAMAYLALDQLAAAEKDFRLLLEKEPENATVLNALGYSLTERTNRHQEALVLIEKAYALNPKEAAIIDSMGWVKFNLGDYAQAVEYLQKAYALAEDVEIASHLIQALWFAGQEAEARALWRQLQKEYSRPWPDLMQEVYQQLPELGE